jgi:cell division septation protein DedD
MAGEFDKELKAMNSAWSDAPESSDLPEGVYTMTIQEAEIRKSKNSGKLRASFRFVVSDGEHLGASQFDGFTLDPDNPVGMSMLKQRLGKQLGYEVPESMQDVLEILADISKKNPIVSAQIIKKGDFTNVRVLEVLGEAEADAQQEPNADADADADADAGTEPEPEPEEQTEPTLKASKSRKAQESQEDESPSFNEGDAVTFENAGETFEGTIKKDNGDGTYNVETEQEVWESVPSTMLTAAGSVQEEEEEEPAEEPEEEQAGSDELRTALLSLAAAHGIDVDEGMDRDTLISTLAEYEWKKSDLVDEEVAALEEAGITVVAEAPKPKPAAKAAKPAAKPAAKAAKPAAKPTSKPTSKASDKSAPKKHGKK